MRKGNFREDLYFRLAVVEINVPPLRERKEDIDLLSLSFVKEVAKENGREIDGISPHARKALFSYSWPGNIRELKNCMESAVVMAKGKTIEFDDLPSHIRGESEKEKAISLELPITMEEAEKALIMETISFASGNKTKAAELLGIGRKTLHRKLSEWKVEDDD